MVEKSGVYDLASPAATSTEMYYETLSNKPVSGHTIRNTDFIVFSNRKI
jgi:hypothetical protein